MQKLIVVFIFITLAIPTIALTQSYVYRITIDETKVQTGFRVKGIKGIITALHGVAGYQKKIIAEKYESSQNYQKTIFDDGVTITKIDIPNDICIINSPKINALPMDDGFAISRAYKTEELKGKAVKIEGFPLGMSAKQNITLQFDNDNPIVELQSYLPSSLAPALLKRNSPKIDISIFDLHGSIVPGHSGAPILYNDEVIGMADGGLSGGTMGFGWAIIIKNVNWVNFENSSIYQKLAASRNELFSYEFAFPENAKLDDYVNISGDKYDIAILVINGNNQIVNPISSGISSLYRSNGYSVTSSLFKAGFLNSSYLGEIQVPNSLILEQLNLPSIVKYIVIGRYSNQIDTGEYTKYISRATLDVVIISCSSKTQIDGFVLHAANGFDDIEHAEQGAIEKLLNNYKLNHTNL